MCLSTLFWNRSIMFILLCFVQPQIWIPYVLMGFRICLYKRNLLWRYSEEFLPISQLVPDIHARYLHKYYLPPCMLHIPPTTLSLIPSPQRQLARRTYCEVFPFTNSSSVALQAISCVKVFSQNPVNFLNYFYYAIMNGLSPRHF
jgi:hypothetical protein